MKKILALAALGVFALVAVAQSGPLNSPHWTVNQVAWRVHNSTSINMGTGFPSSGNDAVGNYLDSLSLNRIGVGGATMPVANADTSATFSTVGWTRPPSVSTTVDSLEWCRIWVTDAGNTSSNVDSCYLALQVSPDGRNWVYVNQVKDAAGLNPVTASSPAVNSFPLLNTAGATTSTPKVFSIGFSTGIRGAVFPDKFNWDKWPLARVILIRKTAGSYACNFGLRVGFWSASEDLNTQR